METQNQLNLETAQACNSQGGGGAENVTSSLGVIRVVKTLRILKLGRLFKVFKIFGCVCRGRVVIWKRGGVGDKMLRIVSFDFLCVEAAQLSVPGIRPFTPLHLLAYRTLSEKLDISPSSLRVFKLLFALSSAMHIAACFFWRVKVGLHLQSICAHAKRVTRKYEINMLLIYKTKPKTSARKWRNSTCVMRSKTER